MADAGEGHGTDLYLGPVTATLHDKPLTKGHFVSSMANARFDVQRADDGTGFVKGVRIFKAGTFRDSMGVQDTWTTEHLVAIVAHFNMFRDNGLFAQVPVRRDHSMSIDKVIGYFQDARVEGSFLVADLEITEPDAMDKFGRGTFRNRSSEIGFYRTNNEELYWPVLLGVAFVDIPAVEGLDFGKNAEGKPDKIFTYVSQNSLEESAVADQPSPTQQPPAPAAAPAPHQFTVAGKAVTDVAQVQEYINGLEAAAAVSATEVTTLRKFRDETMAEGRKAFCDQLATDGKILAAMLPGLIPLAQGMNDEQFAQFKESYDKMEKLSLLSTHAGATNADGTSGGGVPVSQASTPTEIETAEEIIAMWRRQGKDDKFIENTKVFKSLAALRAAAAN